MEEHRGAYAKCTPHIKLPRKSWEGGVPYPLHSKRWGTLKPPVPVHQDAPYPATRLQRLSPVIGNGCPIACAARGGER